MGVQRITTVPSFIILKHTYLRTCSLESGCCRALHKASTPREPTVFCVRFTFLNSEWPEHKAADKASIDAAVNLQPCILLIKKKKKKNLSKLKVNYLNSDKIQERPVKKYILKLL